MADNCSLLCSVLLSVRCHADMAICLDCISTFPASGLTGVGGIQSSWQHEKKENFGQRVDRTLWHGTGWAPVDGMDDFWFKSPVNGLTGHSGMAQVGFKLLEWPAFGSIFGQWFDWLWRLCWSELLTEVTLQLTEVVVQTTELDLSSCVWPFAEMILWISCFDRDPYGQVGRSARDVVGPGAFFRGDVDESEILANGQDAND
ncbi:hypothetical protein Nepgr_007764 [Nepenthes gracilis]|uniref:Secreted protein n=1 Tax=Nepenthes gracilis TaxID=150966 RepID=A0AAD3XIM5_NEPGR|nr:hypothetical protein Nepgr_007764 [Nepenthes gracilis]